MDVQGHNMTGNLSSLVNATNGTATFPREVDYYGSDYGDYYGDYVPFDWANDSYIPALVFLVAFDVIGFCGLVGNVMILVVLQHRTLSSVVYSVYLRFLAVSDLGVIVFRLMESNLDRYDRWQPMLTSSVSLCKVYNFLDLWLSLLSPWLVVCLTTDRFIAVNYPLHWKSLCTKRKALVTCALFTTLAGLFNVSTLVINDVVPDTYDVTEVYCTAQQGYGWHEMAMLMLASVIPCGLIFLLNMLILGRIRATSRERVALTGAGGAGRGATRTGTLSRTGLNSSDTESSMVSPSDDHGTGISFVSTFVTQDSAMGKITEEHPENVDDHPEKNNVTGKTMEDQAETAEDHREKNSSIGKSAEDHPDTGGQNSETLAAGPASPKMNSMFQRDATPEGDASPIGDATSKGDAAPEGDATPKEDAAPEGDAIPKEDGTPERDSTPAGDATLGEDAIPAGEATAPDGPTVAVTRASGQPPLVQPEVRGDRATQRGRTPGTRGGVATQPGRTTGARGGVATQPGQTPGARGGVVTKTRESRVDKATISLTFLSLAAFLTLAPYSTLKGLFMLFLEEFDALQEVDPSANVPDNLKTLVRVWDLLEIVYLLNFCLNFYILLVTNRQVAKATRDTVGRCVRGKSCRF